MNLNLSPNKHLLLLGSTGLFGHELLSRLHLLSHDGLAPQITLVTRSREETLRKYPFLQSIATIIQADFLTTSSLPICNPPTHILHMANMSAVDTFSGAAQYDKYKLLLNSSLALRQIILGGSVERVVFTSSGVAYGNHASYVESDIPSFDHLKIENSMAFGKLTAEFILSSCISDLVSLSIARCFAFVGPQLPTNIHYAIGNFVSNAVNNLEIVIRGDGTDVRSYQHVSDAIDWITYLLVSPDPPLVLNVGSDYPLSILELAQLVKATLSSRSKISVLGNPPPRHNAPRRAYVPDLSLAYSLGLSNKRSLQSSIAELALSLSNA